jgi:hypothetical protein
LFAVRFPDVVGAVVSLGFDAVVVVGSGSLRGDQFQAKSCALTVNV